MAGKLQLAKSGIERFRGGNPGLVMDFPHDAHRALLADFLDAVATGRDPAVTGEEALASQRLVDEILLRARDG